MEFSFKPISNPMRIYIDSIYGFTEDVNTIMPWFLCYLVDNANKRVHIERLQCYYTSEKKDPIVN